MTRYRETTVKGMRIFYREAGPADAPTIVLLHGFPSSSHMFRDLIPKLADHYHVIAPDYVGFGYSDQPTREQFVYTFENLTEVVEKLLFDELGLTRFSIYVQDYGAPVGFRIASRHAEAVDSIIVQNGNAYVEGISSAFESLSEFWQNRTHQSEKAVRGLLSAETTMFQYTHGAKDLSKVSPDAYVFDQHFLDRPGNDNIQLDLLHDYPSNVALYEQWHAYFRSHQPRTLIVWGQNDPYFTVDGARAYLRDLPQAELHLLDGGHFALEEYTEEIASLIRKFLMSASKDAAESHLVCASSD